MPCTIRKVLVNLCLTPVITQVMLYVSMCEHQTYQLSNGIMIDLSIFKKQSTYSEFDFALFFGKFDFAVARQHLHFSVFCKKEVMA